MFTRRRFLHALGLGAAALPVLGYPRRAQAEAASHAHSPAAAGLAAAENVATPTGERGPLRFIGVFTPHGRARELWVPGPDFDLRYPGCVLSPFDDSERFGKSFRDQLLVLDGVDLAAGIEVGTVGHDASRVMLTGSGADGKTASVDQFLAVEQGLGAATPHTSLVLGVGADGSEIGVNISYAAGGTPIPKWIDPAFVYDELFGAPLTGQERAELTARRARGQSALDVLVGDLAQLSSRAPTSERFKLEQHTTALREIEKRLNRKPPRCAASARPDASNFPKLKAYGGGERYFEHVTALQIDLLARAVACDLSRFATLYLADLSRTQLFPDYPIDVHTDVAHRYDAKTDKRAGDPETWRLLALQNRHSYSQVARLMQRLDEAGVLEDTVIYVSSDMGDPARHSSRDVPTLIAGGAGGKLKLGRYVDLSSQKAKSGAGLYPNNRILVSLCNLFDVPVSRFGNSANPATLTGACDALQG